MATPKKRPAQEVGSIDIINRLRAARDIARTCYAGAEAAYFNFTPEAHKLARGDYAGFKQYVELWFSRWDAALQDFDKLVDAELWERIELAARNLEPLEIAGFKFATAHQVARRSLQWWLNLRKIWEIDGQPIIGKLMEPKERCRALLDMAKEIRRSAASGEIEARIIREFSLAIADLDADRMPEIRNEDDELEKGDWWATTPPSAGWHNKPLIGTKATLARCIGVALRGKRVDEKTLPNMHGKSVWIYRVNRDTWQAYFHTDTILANANAELAKVLVELSKTEQIKDQTGTQKGAKRSKRDQTG